MNYYNEFDPKAAAWLRELIARGHIPAGVVDERSIEDITPKELEAFTQCHFFAGIAGWPRALWLSGWPDDKPVWTGSCPCQPFSTAGKGKGIADERHLWPAFRKLIATCRPSRIFGEQVASRDGRHWMERVRFDLESIHYWSLYHENLHTLLAAKTANRLSEILGEIAGRSEAFVQAMSEGVREHMETVQQREEEGESSAASSQGKGIQASVQRVESRETSCHRSNSAEFEEEFALRFGKAPAGDRGENTDGGLRDDWPTVQLSLDWDSMEQPVHTSARSEDGIYLQEHPNRVLWYKRGPGELGGSGAQRDCKRMVREGHLNDERAIAEIFGAIIEASFERLRLAGIQTNVEGMAYAVGAADLCAAGIGAPHIRQRLYWMAHNGSGRREMAMLHGASGTQAGGQRETGVIGGGGLPLGLAHMQGSERNGDRAVTSGQQGGSTKDSRVGNARRQRDEFGRGTGDVGCTAGQEQGEGEASQRERSRDADSHPSPDDSGMVQPDSNGCVTRYPTAASAGYRHSPDSASFWADSRVITTRDGKNRRIPTEPALFPLVDGLPYKLAPCGSCIPALLKGSGNAIVPQVAAQFIQACEEASNDITP